MNIQIIFKHLIIFKHPHLPFWVTASMRVDIDKHFGQMWVYQHIENLNR